MIKRLGFTLLELLVVIAILGFIATIAIAALESARTQARDAQRLQTLDQVTKALELFYDEHGVYPCGEANDGQPATANDGTTSHSSTCDGTYTFIDGDANASATNCTGIVQTIGIISGGYMSGEGGDFSNCIEDPTNDNTAPPRTRYQYNVNASRQMYVIGTFLESEASLPTDGKMANDGGVCDDTYEVGPGTGVMYPGRNVGYTNAVEPCAVLP